MTTGTEDSPMNMRMAPQGHHHTLAMVNFAFRKAAKSNSIRFFFFLEREMVFIFVITVNSNSSKRPP